MKLLKSILQKLILPVVVLVSACNAADGRPNVIVIMTDDQGYGDIAAHGNPVIITPNLDKLHSESVRFTDFHVNSFCAPTRAALMTGRMSDRTHVRTTVQLRNHLNREETTMAEFFKASGYRTGHFGKWHLGQNYPYRPIDRGFDQWVGHGDGGTGTASDYWGNDKMNDTYLRNGKWKEFKGFGNDIFFNETMNFIKECRGEPFFVYLATNVPHGPWNVLKEWREPYKDIKKSNNSSLSENEKDFLATISRFDQNMGRLRDFLLDNNLNENTIIIFLTDNGTSGGNTIYNANMRGKKGSVYEGGHRVPCFIHWPEGGLNKGVDIDRLTAHIDLLPTLVEICELRTPERGHLKLDGRSLVPLFDNRNMEWEDRTMIMHVQNVKEVPIKTHNSLVISENWRLINGEELYDIKFDPSQKNNVAAQNPDIVKMMSGKYDEYWNDIRQGYNPYPRPIIGSVHAEETWLTPDSWILDRSAIHIWSQVHVLRGVKNNGFWPVEIANKGRYQFDVRRWPKELNLPIRAALPAQRDSDITRIGKPISLGEGNAIPAVKVRLRVGDVEMEKDINDTDSNVLFDLELQPGPTLVRAWLIDEEGNSQGNYYVYVKRIVGD